MIYPQSTREMWQSPASSVFLAPLFSAGECRQLLDAICPPTTARSEVLGPVNSMQDYGKPVRTPLLNSWISELCNTHLRDTIKLLFPSLPGYEFSSHYAFLTVYSEEANQDLALHVDASHITLNICLEGEAEGAELAFTGARCFEHVNSAPDKYSAILKLGTGDAILHSGNQRHFVTDLLSGQRKNLVIWLRLQGEEYDHRNAWIKEDCRGCTG